MDKKNNTGLVIGIVVVILAIIVIIMAVSKKPAMAPTIGATSTSQEQATSTPAAGATTGAVTNGTGAASISYEKALVTYKDRRIQFNDACQATPNKVTYKDNTGLMLDNRTAKALTIKVGTTYTVPAYGFKIITLPDTYKNASTYLVDCGKLQNVATILIQE